MLTNAQLKEILIKENYIDESTATNALIACNNQGLVLLDYLISERIISKSLIGQAIAEFYKVNFADLDAHPPIAELLLRIPEDIAKKYNIICFAEDEQYVFIATSNPLDTSFILDINEIFPDKDTIILFAYSEDINRELLNYNASLESQFENIIDHDTSAPEVFRQIVKYAYNFRASDIHFEPTENIVQVRFRIDGMLQHVANLEKSLFNIVTNHVKVIAKIKTDEHNAFLDGSLRYQFDEDEIVDLRISIIPTVDGQKIAVKVISKKTSFLNLKALGMSDKDCEIAEKAYRKPFGLILTSGPIGSGKTTSLYSILKSLNKPQVNITTIEDPVETKIFGINQIQVNPDAEVTFAKGLRSIVRQDLDVIMVGEIRDQETAQIAVNAALTGHLLLSTFHSSDSFTVIPRLLNMGIEPYLLASTLSLIITQRLVRKICTYCRVSISVQEVTSIMHSDIFPRYFTNESVVFYGKGCNACNGTGYKERIGVFELINITENIQNLITSNPSSNQIRKMAKKEGAKTFFEDGIDKVKLGITSMDELIRVSGEDF